MVDSQTLEQAADLIDYEYSMMLGCFEELARPGQRNPFHKNVYLEAFLIHCRNVWDFLECRRSGDDDILASHFVDGWEPPVALGRDRRVALNKRLAHLSYERITYEASGDQWPVGLMTQDLVTSLNAFFDALTESQRSWFGPNDDPAGFDPDLYESS